MKYYIAILFTTLLLTSCETTKEVNKEAAKSGKANTTTVGVAPQKKQDSVEITVGTGTKVGTTQPIKDMETAPPMTENDSIVEINPQAFIPPIQTEKFNHAELNNLLKKYVSDKGNVNYEGFRKNSKALRDYIASLGKNMPNESWSKNDKLAYWMNAYNAMTVDLILRNLPLESIKDIDKPWDQRLWKLGDKWYNLDEIEHQILRKMDEPKIHFGINCASFSCPPLLNEAFTADKVDSQLTFLAKRFINDGSRNTLTTTSIEVSKIFNWFSKDFKQNGSLIDFLNQYSETKISANAKVRYKDYDWALNN
ncbi:DUF547 domain-containing protein [Rasiella sp. SM2506]|uniref:DUF547 domain-containing protein n=1 Tax=Rasiella sp. SM2506 TaxID=3423914 RepID=UPI003D79DC1C